MEFSIGKIFKKHDKLSNSKTESTNNTESKYGQQSEEISTLLKSGSTTSTNNKPSLSQLSNDIEQYGAEKAYEMLCDNLSTSEKEDVKKFINDYLRKAGSAYDDDAPYKKVADENYQVVEKFATTPPYTAVENAKCGPIHESASKILNDAGYASSVISGISEDKTKTGEGHATLLYKVGDTYTLNDYGERIDNIEANNLVDAAKYVYSRTSDLASPGIVMLQGVKNGETYVEYYPKKETVFGEKIDKNGTLALKDNLKAISDTQIDLTKGFPFKTEQNESGKISVDANVSKESSKTLYAAIANYQKAKGVNYNHNIVAGTQQNDAGLSFDTSSDKAVKYSMDINKKDKNNLSADLIYSDFNAQSNLLNELEFKRDTNIKTAAMKISDTHYNKLFGKDNLSVNAIVNAKVEGFGTAVKTDASRINFEQGMSATQCDFRLQAGVGSQIKYADDNFKINAGVLASKTFDQAFNNNSEQKFMLSPGFQVAKSVEGEYKNDKVQVYASASNTTSNTIARKDNLTSLNAGVNVSENNPVKVGANVNAQYERIQSNLHLNRFNETLNNQSDLSFKAGVHKTFGGLKANVGVGYEILNDRANNKKDDNFGVFAGVKYSF
jgi:hypothetical protein